jgi:hypothetical protein
MKHIEVQVEGEVISAVYPLHQDKLVHDKCHIVLQRRQKLNREKTLIPWKSVAFLCSNCVTNAQSISLLKN